MLPSPCLLYPLPLKPPNLWASDTFTPSVLSASVTFLPFPRALQSMIENYFRQPSKPWWHLLSVTIVGGFLCRAMPSTWQEPTLKESKLSGRRQRNEDLHCRLCWNRQWVAPSEGSRVPVSISPNPQPLTSLSGPERGDLLLLAHLPPTMENESKTLSELNKWATECMMAVLNGKAAPGWQSWVCGLWPGVLYTFPHEAILSRDSSGPYLHDSQHMLVTLPEEDQDDPFKIPTKQANTYETVPEGPYHLTLNLIHSYRWAANRQSGRRQRCRPVLKMWEGLDGANAYKALLGEHH